MSYSLVFSREAAPLQDQEAWSWLDERMTPYYQDKRGPHPDFKNLYDQLTAMYPCICSLPDDKIDEGVWSDGPLINNFAQDLAMVAFSFNKAEEVLPFILEVASRLKIVVFDHQTRTIYRP